MVELLKQYQYEPYDVTQQVISIFAGVNGYLDRIPTAACRDFERELLQYMDTRYPQLVRDIAEKKEITSEIEATLRQAIEEYRSNFLAKAEAA